MSSTSPQPPPPKTFPKILPRLPPEYYLGDAVVFWTFTTFDRRTGWLNDKFHTTFRELMLHTLIREKLLCPIYCLMPDHLHFIWMGCSPPTNQKKAIAFFRTHLEPQLKPAKFQTQAHDHVLRVQDRRKNAFTKICNYIAENPVRAGLAITTETWSYTNCLIPGYPKLHPFVSGFWDKFWKIYHRLKDPAASQITKPPF
jgi:putative transposase